MLEKVICVILNLAEMGTPRERTRPTGAPVTVPVKPSGPLELLVIIDVIGVRGRHAAVRSDASC